MDGDFACDPSTDPELTSGAPLRDFPSRPKLLAALLMKLAGVDYAEALRAPANEQEKMVLIGAGLLLGAAFQATCIWTVLGIMFGEDASAVARAMVTFITTGVLFVFDCKFVAADWRAQGLAYCRSRGLVEPPTILERLKRPASVFLRCTISFSIAALVATLFMILVFRPAIDRTLLEENRTQNAAVFNDAKLQFDRRVRELGDHIAQLDRAADALVAERASLLLPIPGDETIKRQIEHINEEIDRWRQDKAEATRGASLHESDRNAEQRGVRQRPGNTGQEGAGPQFRFHDQEAKRLRQVAAARTADIETGSEKLIGLRREAAVTVQQAEVTRTARLSTIDGDIREIGKTKAAAIAERAALHDGREAWIDRRVRIAANYKPVATDLSDRLRALLIVATASPLIFTLMTALKLTIMMIESAGPIAKVFFTPAGIYGMRIALRVEDAADHERDRREDSAHNLQQRRDRREQDRQTRVPARRRWDATTGAEEKFARVS